MKDRHATVAPAIRIRDVLDLDARAASRELVKFGLTVIDDISEMLVETADDELADELGHARDEMDIHIDRVDTGWGPVFVFRDRSRVTLASAKAAVFALRPKP